MEPATHRRSHADFTLSRADGAGMKILIAIVAGSIIYAIGYVGGQDQQLQQSTPICQIKQ
jgi:hypothetical protein